MKKPKSLHLKSKISIGLIPAAGQGNRMAPIKKSLPKVMLPLCEKPIIDYVVDLMTKQGIEKIYIIIGYQGDKIKNYFDKNKKNNITIKYIKQNNLNGGLAYAIGLAEKYIEKPFLTILGDDLTITPSLKNMINNFYKNKAWVVEGVIKEKKKSILKETCNVILDKDKKIKSIEEKPQNPTSDIRGCGLYIFDPIIFKYIKKTPPTEKGQEITNTISLLAEKGRVFGQFIKGYNININKKRDLFKARKILKEKYV